MGALDKALDLAVKIRDERTDTLEKLTATWYKTWFPRVREGNGRHVARSPQTFVDTGTSEYARRRQEGLLYVMDRQFALPFGEWVNEVTEVRNRYAADHKLPPRQGTFNWQDATTLRSVAAGREL